MVAPSKHHKPARQKVHARRPRKLRTGRLSAPAPLSVLQPSVGEVIPKEDEEPRPEDLAKEEETLKTEGPKPVAVVAGAEAEEPAGPRARERSSYDGDTAI